MSAGSRVSLASIAGISRVSPSFCSSYILLSSSPLPPPGNDVVDRVLDVFAGGVVKNLSSSVDSSLDVSMVNNIVLSLLLLSRQRKQ